MPMGTNYVPPICNIFLYAYESSHIDKLIQEGKPEQAKTYHLTFRLIDDTMSIDNPFYDDLVKCYPRFLGSEDATLEGTNFVGLSVSNGLRIIRLQFFGPFQCKRT